MQLLLNLFLMPLEKVQNGMLNTRTKVISREGPPFIKNSYKIYRISKCPSLFEIKKWYKEKNDLELTEDFANEMMDPITDGSYFTQKIFVEMQYIRDHLTLKLTEDMMQKYKKWP